MKILIITKDTEKAWQPAIKEAKPFIKKLDGTGFETKIDVKTLDFNFGREEYLPNQWGLDKGRLRFFSLFYGKEYDMVMWHDRDFKMEGAGGWFDGTISTKELLITQCFAKLGTKTFPHLAEFNLWHAETLVHEMIHAKYFKRGLPDRTHKFAEQDNLMGAIDYLNFVHKNYIIELLLRFQAKFHKQEVEVCGKIELPVIVHHSCSHPSATVEQVREWSKDYYNVIIRQGVIHHIHDKNHRGFQEVCVVGQFEPSYKKVTYIPPSKENINALKKHIGKRKYMGHKEAGDKGIATPSQCPGDLLKYL